MAPAVPMISPPPHLTVTCWFTMGNTGFYNFAFFSFSVENLYRTYTDKKQVRFFATIWLYMFCRDSQQEKRKSKICEILSRHSCLIPIQSSDVKTLYIFVDIKIDLDHFIQSVELNFEKGTRLGFVSTIQFVPSLQEAKTRLSELGYSIDLAQNQPLSPGEGKLFITRKLG